MTCPLCKRRVKDWTGDDPRCAFPEGGFDRENWNCATMIAVRLLASNEQATALWVDDHNFSMVPIGECFPVEEDGDDHYMAMLVVWYKSRGNTFGLYFLDDINPPTEPRWDEVWRVLDYYRKLNSDLRAYLEELARAA